MKERFTWEEGIGGAEMEMVKLDLDLFDSFIHTLDFNQMCHSLSLSIYYFSLFFILLYSCWYCWYWYGNFSLWKVGLYPPSGDSATVRRLPPTKEWMRIRRKIEDDAYLSGGPPPPSLSSPFCGLGQDGNCQLLWIGLMQFKKDFFYYYY